jgi:hypothetical protein
VGPFDSENTTLKLLSPSHIPPVSGFEPGTFGVRSRHSTNELLSNSEKCCSKTVPVHNCRPQFNILLYKLTDYIVHTFDV